MGGVFGKPSTLTVETVNNIINTSILKLSSNTTVNNDVTQYIKATGGSSITDVTQYTDVKNNMSSILSATQNSDFNADLKNNVQQDLQSETVALLGAFDSLLQNKNVSLKNKINNTIDNLNLIEIAPVCATNNDIVQSIIAEGKSSISGVSQTVKADFIQKCTTIIDDNMSTVSDITNAINQRAKLVSENPLNPLTEMFKGGTNMIIIVIIVIVIGFIILIGPGKLDANAIVKDSIRSSKETAIEMVKITPQGRIATVTKAIK
jgi:hypothetical protein